jgi:hypothetical protein
LKRLSSPRTILAVDPGKRKCGVALFVNERLTTASLLTADNTFLLGKTVWLWWLKQAEDRVLDPKLDRLVTEGQVVYPGLRTANPNDLLPLSYLCGAVQARVEAEETLMPLPREWKGSLKKELFTRQILSRLHKEELAIVDQVKCPKGELHNVVDAVGLGLWTMGAIRLHPPKNEVV